MAAPIYNPIIPCVHPIPGGMYPGRMIRVQGNVPPGGQRFAINFQCGPNTDPRDDIALHLNFRFVEMCVVRNHLTAMNWGVEDTAGGMPLARGESFEALILCEPQSIKIALNGIHFCEFLHRVPFQRISHLTIDGDVHIQFIGFEGAQPPQQMYMAEPPAYGSYGAPPPAYGAPGYGGPQGYTAVAAPGAYQTSYGVPQQRSGMGTGAAVGLGVGALAAGGLAGYALGGGFSRDSPTSEGYINTDTREDDDYLQASAPQEAENVERETEDPVEQATTEEEVADDDYLDNDDNGQDHVDVQNDNEGENNEAAPEAEVVEGIDTEVEINEGDNAIPPYVEEVDELAELVENKLETHDENKNETEVNEEDNAIPPYVDEPAAEADIETAEENNEVEVNEEENTIPPYEEEVGEPEEVNIVDNFGDGDWME